MSFIPRDPRLTLALLVLFGLLAIYVIWARDPIGYVILILVGIFVALPILFLYLGHRREGLGLRDFLSAPEDEDAPRE